MRKITIGFLIVALLILAATVLIANANGPEESEFKVYVPFSVSPSPYDRHCRKATNINSDGPWDRCDYVLNTPINSFGPDARLKITQSNAHGWSVYRIYSTPPRFDEEFFDLSKWVLMAELKPVEQEFYINCKTIRHYTVQGDYILPDPRNVWPMGNDPTSATCD